MNAILEVEGLTRRFGALAAVNNVSLSVRTGEIRALIGPNGSGKTTFFNLLTGRLKPSAGAIRFRGEDIAGRPPHLLVRAGIGRSFQITNIFPRLTVLENIMIAVLAKGGMASRMIRNFHDFPSEKEEARALLRTIGLVDKAELPTSMLSHGDRRNLELGLTLALKPILLLLDEPTAGMSPEETASTVELMRRISADTTILFTEHDMAIVFGIADRVTVLQQGGVIAEGTPAEIRVNPAVISAYLGD